MSDHFLRLRVGYQDEHLIELRVRVVRGEWSAASAAYVSHSFLAETGEAILQWVKAPFEPLRVEAGADTGVGHMILQFSKIDDAGHVRCAVRLAAAKQTDGRYIAEVSRFAMELPTELGFVERFGRECIALGRDLEREANLTVLAM